MPSFLDHRLLFRHAALCSLSAVLIACGGGGGGGGSTRSGSADIESVGAADAPAPYQLTYYGDTQSILDAKCGSCHREGGLAPFHLADIEQVQRFHSAIVYAVESGSMPPAGNVQLTPDERERLLAWLAPSRLAVGTPSQLPATAYTWWRDTKAIVEQRCALCHIEGGLAPFPLQTWSDIVDIRAAALYSVRSDTMPPWNPTNGYTALQHNLSLPREEKAVLIDWLAGGAPEGNPADARAGEPRSLEQVDWEMKLRLPQAYTPTIFPDEYRCFVVDWPGEEQAYITASNFLPQFAAQIHHVFVTIVPPESVADYKAAEQRDGKPGYTCFGDTRIPGELPTSPPADVLGWGPGINSQRLPAGTGIQISPGSALAVQIHFNTLTTEPLPERSEMVFVTETTVERPGATAYVLDIANWIFAENLLIPAGEDDVSFQYDMPVSELKSIFNRPELNVGAGDAIAIHRASLHMHTLGKSGRLSLVRADGTEQVLLDARNWDFNWQNKYLMQREIIVQSEDSIRTQCVYDNTAENQPVFNGQALPVRDVRWGDNTTDEMCAATLFFTRVKEPRVHTPSVHIGRPQVWQTFTPGALMPLELRLNNFVLEPPGEHRDSPVEHHGQAETGRGHYHIYFDTDDDGDEHVTDWRQQPVVRVPRGMAPGLHRVRVSLRGSDHHALGIEDSVEFRVADSSVDTGAAVPLIEHNRWLNQLPEADPFSQHRPREVDCPVSATALENGALEVQTGVCNYLALQQGSLQSIAAGDRIRLVLWHQQLRNEQPGRAHVGLALGGEVLWQLTTAIPNDGGFYDVEIESPADFAAGSVLDLHLHNHGFNSWTILSVDWLPAR